MDKKDAPRCACCGKPGCTLHCGRCKKVWYCNRTCQSNHWKPSHQHECRPPKAAPSKFQTTECVICLETFTNEHEIQRIRCQHRFHKNCVNDLQRKGVQSKHTCPLCRRSLPVSVDTLAADALTLTMKADRGKLSGEKQRELLNMAHVKWGEVLNRDPTHDKALHYLTEEEIMRGGYEQVSKLLKKGLEGMKQTFGLQDSRTQGTLIRLGHVYYCMGNYSAAKNLYQKVLSKTQASADDFTLGVMANLAATYAALKLYKDSEKLYKQTLRLLRPMHALAVDNELVLSLLSNMAHLYIQTNRPELALENYTRALFGMEKMFGGDHPSTLAAMNGKALALKELKRYPESIRIYRLSLERREKRFGLGTPKVILARWNLAQALAEDCFSSTEKKEKECEELNNLLEMVSSKALEYPNDAQCRKIASKMSLMREILLKKYKG